MESCSKCTHKAPAPAPAPPTTSTPKKSFYRRPLPDGCIDFASQTGKQIFKEALGEGGMEVYFSLAAQFHTQEEPAYCGLGTLSMVLNRYTASKCKIYNLVLELIHKGHGKVLGGGTALTCWIAASLLKCLLVSIYDNLLLAHSKIWNQCT